VGGHGPIIDWCSRGSFGGSEPGLHGAICLSGSGRARRCGTGSNAWSQDGTFDQILQVLQGQAHAAGQVDWTVSVDATIARAHQHAAGAPHRQKGGSLELQEFLARAG
jgi:hypothetical protein